MITTNKKPFLKRIKKEDENVKPYKHYNIAKIPWQQRILTIGLWKVKLEWLTKIWENQQNPFTLYSHFSSKIFLMTSRQEILDEIMFYILERAKREGNTDKYLEHVLDYWKSIINRFLKKRIRLNSIHYRNQFQR